MHVEVSRDGCVAAPIIRGPRPLPTATTHPPNPTPNTPISLAYHTLKCEEPNYHRPHTVCHNQPPATNIMTSYNLAVVI